MDPNDNNNEGPVVVFANTNENKLNITAVSLTCNSNIAPGTPEYAQDLMDMFKQLFQTILSTGQAVQWIFGNKDKIKKIQVNSISPEIGSVQKRVHINLNVTLQHVVPRYSVTKLAKRLKEFLDYNDTPSKGWHVHARLGDRRGENYDTKVDRWANNDRVDKNTDEEIKRLSTDNSKIVETTKKVKGITKQIRVLQIRK